ncbi:hypothetical protein [Naasia aerilata]|uniref:Uncharacterized protein n=1 Tax=Naasia aerilata TaxID=1162966 RepID=A0ABN6XLG5_9MICO|nr:hypothetical protein [Naasia aerilata]BDZ44183.1 hypothetical protein GCM10025866_00920 [Naasia aerilata]
MPDSFRVSIDGQTMTLSADESVRKGATSTLLVGVRDPDSEGQAGRLQLRVVASTRPLAIPAADTAVAPAARRRASTFSRTTRRRTRSRRRRCR